jgi:sugar fermentation stimulation protein A
MEDYIVRFPRGCLFGRLLKREKRFRVLVEMDGRGPIWVHCNNSGSLLGVWKEGRRAFLSPAANPNRKLPFTLELVRVDGWWVGVNTMTPNRALFGGWRRGVIPQLEGYTSFRREVPKGSSWLDALLEGPGGRLWVEAKNVTLVKDDVACFPDAVTERGRRHLDELKNAVRMGERAACFFLVQREDATGFGPAEFIDPEYARSLREAVKEGVELWAYQARVSPEGITIFRPLPVVL